MRSRGGNVELLTVKQAARKFGLRLPTLYQALRERRVRGIRVGGRWLVPAEAVQAAIDRGLIRLPEEGNDGERQREGNQGVLSAANSSLGLPREMHS